MSRSPRSADEPIVWRREAGTVLRTAVTAVDAEQAPFVILAQSERPGAPTEWRPHAHTRHELVWVRNGTLSSRVGDRLFTVPEGSGLWMPAGVVHTGRLTAKVEFYDAFFDPDRTPIAFPVPTMITMTPVLASLLTHLERTDLDPAARARAEAVVFDLLEPAPRQLALRLPGRSREHARIGPITETLLRDPGDPRSLDDWARELGLSERTVTRAFRQATGMSFARWRQTLRIHDAVHLLSEGTEVKAVAALVGYAQTSTFIAAFRREMGITPGSLGSAPGRVLTGLGADDVRNPASAVPIP